MNFPVLYEVWTHVEEFLCHIRGPRVSYKEGLQKYDEVCHPSRYQYVSSSRPE